jgi:hypothetical protein
MPHVEGETLRSRLNRDGTIPVSEAIRIITRLASALDYAHRRGVIHRDIKPENIMLCEGEPLLLDFGIAKAISAAAATNLTQTGFTIGTPAYLSPEQASGETRLDGRTDQYSLACTFYEMASGRPPFTAPTPQRVIGMRLSEKPRHLSTIAHVPRPLSDMVVRALSVDPADRFDTVQEFAASLEQTERPEHRVFRVRSGRKAILLGTAAAVGLPLVFLAQARFQAARDLPVKLAGASLVTNSGHAMHASVSPDGKTLAYINVDCDRRSCTQSLDLKDIDGAASRRIAEGIDRFGKPALQWSPDGRSILFSGKLQGHSGTVLLSAIGGAPRRVGTGAFSFWSGGDSLITARAGEKDVRILFSGLDGIATDSIMIHRQALDVIVVPIPNSRWIALGLKEKDGVDWLSINRNGTTGGTLNRRYTLSARASNNAVWFGEPQAESDLMSVIRIAFNATTGRFASREDTVFTGQLNSVDVTPDGTTLIVNQMSSEFSGWALSIDNLARSEFPIERRLVIASSRLDFEISPDGRRIIIGRHSGSAVTGGRKWVTMPFEGGPENQISGAPCSESSSLWVDSITICTWSPVTTGFQLARLNIVSGERSDEFVHTDSGWIQAAPLSHGGWVWNSERRAIKTHRPGESIDHAFRLPPDYPSIQSFAPSSDGARVVLTGFNTSGDSAIVSVLSLSTGRVDHVRTVPAVGGFATWLSDGTIMLAAWEKPDAGLNLYRFTAQGNPISHQAIAGRVWGISVSGDMHRAAVTVRDYRGDVSLSKVVPR